MTRREELIKEFRDTLPDRVPLPQIDLLIDFLVLKIEKLEHPMIVLEIPVRKGGDNNGNTKKE